MPLAQSYATQAVNAVQEYLAALALADEFGQAVTVSRAFVPTSEVKNLAAAQFFVATGEYELEKLTRTQSKQSITVRVLIQKFIPEANQMDSVLVMQDIVTRVAELLLWKLLGENSELIPVESKTDPVFAPQDLREFKVYSGVVSATYEVVTAKP